MPTGLHVLHPFTGAELPVWVANYVLMSYGEGAVMGVPAHDERDFEFAQKYGTADRDRWCASTSGAYDDGAGAVDCGLRRVRHHGELRRVLRPHLPGCGGRDRSRRCSERGLGAKRVQWRLRDWGISRQRYWGCPIPIIHCESCGAVPVPDKELPVVLPEDLVPDGSGNPLAQVRRVPTSAAARSAAGRARRETDTMDTFVDSSWYFMRYACPDSDTRRWSTSASATGCRSTSTSAASSTRSCTCCTRASGRG